MAIKRSEPASHSAVGDTELRSCHPGIDLPRFVSRVDWQNMRVAAPGDLRPGGRFAPGRACAAWSVAGSCGSGKMRMDGIEQLSTGQLKGSGPGDLIE
jgi:hypothetical protein